MSVPITWLKAFKVTNIADKIIGVFWRFFCIIHTYIMIQKKRLNHFSKKYIFFFNHKYFEKNLKFRAFSSQVIFATPFFKTFFGFSKMDKNKCPKSKTQNTFWKKFVIEKYIIIY